MHCGQHAAIMSLIGCANERRTKPRSFTNHSATADLPLPANPVNAMILISLKPSVETQHVNPAVRGVARKVGPAIIHLRDVLGPLHQLPMT